MINVSVRRPVRAEYVAQAAAPEVARVLNSEMVHVAGGARRNVQTKGITASGALARSMQGGAYQTGPATVDGWIGGEPYWPYVEGGTRPHTPPLDPLIRWVRSKKLLQKGAMPVGAGFGVAIAISKSIAEKRGSAKGPPAAVILAWMAKRGIRVSRKTAERQLAFAVQRKIAAKGTKPHPFVEPALAGRWERLVDNVMAATVKGEAGWA